MEWAQEEDERTQRAARRGGPSMERTTIYIVSIVVLTITLTVEVLGQLYQFNNINQNNYNNSR